MQQRCPSCGRAWVPGEARCPFCGATLGAVPGAVPPGAMPGPFPPGGAGFQLQWVGPNGMPRGQPVPSQGLRLGRGTENDVVLDDTQVSRVHAVIWAQGGQCYVQDAGSTNGTFVNGQHIGTAQVLRPGDQIAVGRTVFRLATAPAVVPQAVPAAMPRAMPGAYPMAGGPGMPPAQFGFPPQPYPAPSGRPVTQVATFTPGRGITLAGVLAILLMFFMPWVSWTDPVTGRISLSGYQIATLSARSLQESAGMTGTSAAQAGVLPLILFLAPGAGLIVLVLAVIGIFLSNRAQLPLLLVQILLTLGTAALLVWFYLDLGPGRDLLTIDFGYWGSWVAVLIMLAGAIVDLVRVGTRPGG
jgi:hypothetical protein